MIEIFVELTNQIFWEGYAEQLAKANPAAFNRENILKVLDVHYSQFTKNFIGFIAKQLPVYKDLIMEEDLFSPDGLREDNPEIREGILAELTGVANLMKQWDCGYFRIIYT